MCVCHFVSKWLTTKRSDHAQPTLAVRVNYTPLMYVVLSKLLSLHIRLKLCLKFSRKWKMKYTLRKLRYLYMIVSKAGYLLIILQL